MDLLIFGAGTMGRGIAEVFAAHQIPVYIYDSLPSALERVRSLAEKYPGYIHPVSSLPAKISQKVVLEAIPEDFALKRSLLTEISERLSADTIVATNTSALSVHALAQGLPLQERFLGWHFFNPAPRMPLVEIIPTVHTLPPIIQETLSIIKAVGKVPILAPDLPGFIVNRIARPYYVEALRLAERGDITHQVIDQLMEGLGFRMGPFRLMDLIGIDVNHAVTQRVWEGLFYPERFRPSWLQAQKVAAGHTGRKAGQGFYKAE